MVLSIMMAEPTLWAVLPPVDMSRPVPQLLMEIPMYVQPQSQI
jgi:hypothetical protein